MIILVAVERVVVADPPTLAPHANGDVYDFRRRPRERLGAVVIEPERFPSYCPLRPTGARQDASVWRANFESVAGL